MEELKEGNGTIEDYTEKPLDPLERPGTCEEGEFQGRGQSKWLQVM